MTSAKKTKKTESTKDGKSHVHATDVAAYGKLAVDATLGVVDIVEKVHRRIADTPGVLDGPIVKAISQTADVVLSNIRSVTRATGEGIDLMVGKMAPLLGQMESSAEREAIVSAFNGVLGDHLADSQNPLAISMRIRREGKPLEMTSSSLQGAIANISGKILLVVHGSCMNDLQWRRNEHDHGAALAVQNGFTEVYLHYNSGLHISTNGRKLAILLEEMLSVWPVPVQEVVILAHSMGGLVSRSACHYAAANGSDWLSRLSRIFFLGTPHHGAPLERGGNWVTILLGAIPTTRAYSGLPKIRSAGITDLRYGSIVDEDWVDGDRFAHATVLPAVVSLPVSVKCYAIAAVLAKKSGPLSEQLIGDGLVPLPSALGKHEDAKRTLVFPETRQVVYYGLNHVDMLDNQEIYAQMQRWIEID